MTTTTQTKPKPETRYAKQGAPKGDFAAGERTKPPIPENTILPAVNIAAAD